VLLVPVSIASLDLLLSSIFSCVATKISRLFLRKWTLGRQKCHSLSGKSTRNFPRISEAAPLIVCCRALVVFSEPTRLVYNNQILVAGNTFGNNTSYVSNTQRLHSTEGSVGFQQTFITEREDGHVTDLMFRGPMPAGCLHIGLDQ
jgi:hypothetical protein